jgi:hypothetical protein
MEQRLASARHLAIRTWRAFCAVRFDSDQRHRYCTTRRCSSRICRGRSCSCRPMPVNLVENIRRLKLDVERVVHLHGGIDSMATVTATAGL